MRSTLVWLLAVMWLGCPATDDDDVADDDVVGDDDVADDDDDDVADDDDTGSGDAPLPTELAGRIQVIEHMWEDSVSGATVTAEIWAAAVPTTQVEVAAAGDCVVLKGDRTEPFNCDPECEPGELCVDGECVPYPEVAPAGTISVSGIAEEQVLEPDGSGWYPMSWDIPADLFGPADEVSVTAAGGVTPAFTMSAQGVSDLQSQPNAHGFEPGEDYTIEWEADPASPGRIQVILATGWHGSVDLTTIYCETEDDGEITISGELTGLFQIPSCGECEMSYLRRFTRDVVDGVDGPIELLVASQRTFVPWWDWY